MIAIGTQFYPAEADSERRQARARAALLELDGVVPINLQFVDERFEPEGFRTLPVLRQDSRTVTGAAGARKPVVSEMFDALADAARTSGCRYFAYLNADIEVTPAALAPILAGDRDGYAFSRTDVDGVTGAEIGVQIFGLDMFAIDAGWWARERRRFRPYIAGEACWDNVYAALICAHGRGDIINERPGIFHEHHPAVWNDGPFAEHNGFPRGARRALLFTLGGLRDDAGRDAQGGHGRGPAAACDHDAGGRATVAARDRRARRAAAACTAQARLDARRAGLRDRSAEDRVIGPHGGGRMPPQNIVADLDDGRRVAVANPRDQLVDRGIPIVPLEDVHVVNEHDMSRDRVRADRGELLDDRAVERAPGGHRAGIVRVEPEQRGLRQ
jgi:hypothetical protein